VRGPAPPPLSDLGAQRDWLRHVFERCMSPDDRDAERALAALVDRLEGEASAGATPTTREQPAYWLVSTARRLPRGRGPDRGLFAFYLLNLVHLRAGEALFLRAGEPHAYLEGRGLEVMANSDNVLRGGLTPKHVDLAELLRVLTFDAEAAHPLRPDAEGRYPAPVDEFAARMLTLAPGDPPANLAGGAATVLLVVEGAAVLEAGERELTLARGEAWFVPAAIARVRVHPAGHDARVFAVTVPT
jgi:mannose-6-phosphate isomerase